MNKEIFEVLNKIKKCALEKQPVTLSKKEIHLLLKYINDLKKELAGVIDEL